MQSTSLLNIIAGDQSTAKVYRRLVYLILIVGIAVTLAVLFVNTNQSVNQSLTQFSKSLGRDIAQQYGTLIAKPLADKTPEQADLYIASLVQQSHILSAKIFDKYGQGFIAKPESQDLIALYQAPQARDTLTFIQPIYYDERHVGYLRIIFDHGKIRENQAQLNSVYALQTQLLIILSAVVTFVLTRRFYIWRQRKYFVRKKSKGML